MSAWRKFVGLVSALTALVGCDEGPASNLSFTTTPDLWGIVTAAATAGPLPVVIHGNPFRAPADAVSREMVAAIASAFPEPWLRFAAMSDASAPEPRLIWLLDPESGFNADQVCAGRLPGFAAERRVTEIRAVFCHRDRALSAVHGWMRRPDSPADPRWRQLMAQMARQLLRGTG
jgi:hypothetical protein